MTCAFKLPLETYFATNKNGLAHSIGGGMKVGRVHFASSLKSQSLIYDYGAQNELVIIRVHIFF